MSTRSVKHVALISPWNANKLLSIHLYNFGKSGEMLVSLDNSLVISQLKRHHNRKNAGLTDSSIKSTLKSRPCPFELDHSLMLDFDVTRAQIVHLYKPENTSYGVFSLPTWRADSSIQQIAIFSSSSAQDQTFIF